MLSDSLPVDEDVPCHLRHAIEPMRGETVEDTGESHACDPTGGATFTLPRWNGGLKPLRIKLLKPREPKACI